MLTRFRTSKNLNFLMLEIIRLKCGVNIEITFSGGWQGEKKFQELLGALLFIRKISPEGYPDRVP